MLSRDSLALSPGLFPRSALCLPTCFLLSPHMFPHVLAMVWLGQLFVSPLVSICLPTCFLTCLLGWMQSRDGLARSALCFSLVSSLPFSRAPAIRFPCVSRAHVASRACGADCRREMVRVARFKSLCVPTSFQLFSHLFPL